MFITIEFWSPLCGVIIGFLICHISSIQLRRATLIGLCFLCGLVINLLNDEAWTLVLFDALSAAVFAGTVRLLQMLMRNARLS
ncbi:MAG: hypothetical protein U0Z53_23145 [Blastocatellia bacterium]